MTKEVKNSIALSVDLKSGEKALYMSLIIFNS